MLLSYIDTLHTINQHIDKVLENAPTKLKVSVNINDADWQKIQELFAKERQRMPAQMQTHIREVTFGIFVVAGGVGMIIAQSCGK